MKLVKPVTHYSFLFTLKSSSTNISETDPNGLRETQILKKSKFPSFFL